MKWYEVYTKPKREDAVADSLENVGIEVFNPRLKQKKYMQGAYRNKISLF